MLNFAEATTIQAKTKDGKILQSSNFDVNDDVEEVSEDGTVAPVTDGSYEITFTNPEGNESTQVIDVKDGKIEEISTPSEEADEEAGAPEETEEEMDDMAPAADVTMAKDFVEAPKGSSSKEPAHALPMGTDEDPRNRVGSDEDDKKDPIISLSYRISELESQLKECMSKIGELTDRKNVDQKGEQTTETEDNVSLEEVDVPKLDGAPIEMSAQVNLAGVHKPNNKREGNYQSSFLSKLYK
jgi:hypothetical protein